MADEAWSLAVAAVGLKPVDPDIMQALLDGMSGPDVGLCITDENDDIRYASPSFRTVFFPDFDGTRSNFMATIELAIRAGTAIKLVSAPPDDFARIISERRKRQSGSYSFAVDMCDGSWWWVTDVKLPKGWMVTTAQNISSLKHEEFRLRDAYRSAAEEAQTDCLTGVPNRRHGLRQAELLFEAAREAGRSFLVALLDIDHFKPINDRHGHETGDRALQHFAQHMTETIGDRGHFSRLGGDEFLLVMPDGAAADMLDCSLERAVATLSPLSMPDRPEGLRFSVSIGTARLRPADTWPTLLHRADKALYEAKANGRDRVAYAA